MIGGSEGAVHFKGSAVVGGCSGLFCRKQAQIVETAIHCDHRLPSIAVWSNALEARCRSPMSPPIAGILSGRG